MSFTIKWTRMKAMVLVVIALQLVTLAFFITTEYAILSQDRTIFLRIEPVDPNDVFKGDYVTLDYQISSIDTYYTYLGESDGNELSRGQVVYVRLDSYDNKVYSADQFSNTVLTQLPTQDISYREVFIKGSIVSLTKQCQYNNDLEYEYNLEREIYFEKNDNDCGEYKLTMRYGIEQYYVEQGKGREIENKLRSSSNSAYAMVKISKDGQARVVGLEIDGVKY